MRPLKIGKDDLALLGMCLGLVGGGSARAATHTLGGQISQDGAPLPTLLQQGNASNGSLFPSEQRLHFFLRSENSLGLARWEVGLTQVQRDLSRSLVRDEAGVERTLAELGARESALLGSAQAAQVVASVLASAQYQRSLSHDPFHRESLGIGLEKTFHEAGLLVRSNYGSTWSEQPKSTFLDRDFRSKARPTSVQVQDADVELVQTLPGPIKVGVKGLGRWPREVRPPAYGVATHVAAAVTETVFLRPSFLWMKERSHEELRDERGYFELHQSSVSSLWEPHSAWLVEASFSRLREREWDPRVDESNVLVSSQWGLGLSLRWSDFTTKLGAALTSLSNKETFASFQGGVTWNWQDI